MQTLLAVDLCLTIVTGDVFLQQNLYFSHLSVSIYGVRGRALLLMIRRTIR